MKRFKQLLLLTILSITVTACGQDSLEPETGDTIVGVTGTAYNYCVTISFTDAAGNDLVAPLGTDRWKNPNSSAYWHGSINPEKYALEIVLSDPSDRHRIPNPNVVYDKRIPYFMMAKYDSNYQCTSHFGAEYTEGEGKYYLSCVWRTSVYNRYDWDNLMWVDYNPVQDYITYHIACPTIFGDESVHTLVTYWDADLCSITFDQKDARTWSQYPSCTKAYFDGEEVPVETVLVRHNEIRDFYAFFIDIVLDK